MIAKALNIDGLNTFYFVSFHLHTILHFEDQVKIAKLMSHSIYKLLRESFNLLWVKSKKVNNDQELVQLDPKSHPLYQNGK